MKRGLLDDPVPTKSDLVGLLDNPVAREALGYALPWFLNAANTPTGVARAGVDVARALPGAVQKMAQDGYAGVVGHMTGEVPLVTGEPGRPHTEADTRRGTEYATNAAAAAGLASVAAPARAAALGARTRPASAFTAYHGSPHDFDRFSMDKIGTGEGAQAYGHGLYFAENPKVAKEYQDLLTDRHAPSNNLVFDTAEEAAQLAGQDGRVLTVPPSGSDAGKFYAVDSKGARITGNNKGNLYEVNIKANKDDFLDFDSPLSDPNIRARLESVKGSLSGRAVEDLEDVLRISKNEFPLGTVAQQTRLFRPEITRAMKEMGIPGIKYKDQGSRGAEVGTYNYVIFDDNLIEIAKKNGIPAKQTDKGFEVDEAGMKALAALQVGSQQQQTQPGLLDITSYGGGP